ncbi:MAG: HDIG domain-containing protein, partial [Opitutales bacterium]|nr:HDIG domain-containing protein [Opitutales bacterium]
MFSRLRKMRGYEIEAHHRKQELEIAKREAELAARDIRSQAEENAQKRIAEAEKMIEERKIAAQKIEQTAMEVQARAAELSVKLDERLVSLRKDEENLVAEKKSLDELRERYENKLLDVAKLSREAARDAAVALEIENAREDTRKIRREILEKAEDEFSMEAHRILIDTMQRIAPRVNEQDMSELVPIPSEETKGRLIGREGRNIKCFEQVTGATLIIDDTPGSVLVSCFDPFRRRVAALALRRLIADGRIHPQSIEHFVKSSHEELLGNAIETGTKACEDLGIFHVDERLLELLGKLQFRLSINQNTLTHSVETAQLCGILASELGLNVSTATRAGLFHDIGKALDAENETAHALAGARILKQAGESAEVINAVESHHREVGHTTIYGPLLMLADSISATRPGARSSTREGYAERIRSLEAIARRFDGVIDAFAIQAGHEVRVIVSSEEVNDSETRVLAQKIR